MNNLIRADFYRMKKSKFVYILIAIVALCAVGATLVSYFMENASLSASFTSSASGLADMMVIMIAGPFLAGLFICNDFQSKTIHDSILYAKGRKAVVFSKLISYSCLMGLLVLPYVVCTFIGFLSGGKFSSIYSHSVDSVFFSILANETEAKVNTANIIKLLAILLTAVLVYVARMSLCLLLVYTIRRPVVVVGVGIALEMGLSFVALLGGSSEVVKQCLGWTPFAMYSSVLTMDASWKAIIKAAGSSLVFINIVNGITGALFDQSDIK